MKRRSFLVAAAAPLVAAVAPQRLFATAVGGGSVALVTADLESRLVAVETSSGRLVKRIATAPGPRSIESNGFGLAIVAHTVHGVVSVVDAATLTVLAEIRGFGAPRYTALHPTERLAYVSDSGHQAIAVVDLARREVVRWLAVPGPARHLSLNGDGTRLWTALGTKAERLAVIDVSDPRRPRLLRTIAPPFLAHDVVFAPDARVWVTSGSRDAIAVYGSRFAKPDAILRAGAPPQHIAFSASRAYVASGEDGTVRVHRLDGSGVGPAARVPHGSYNVTFGGPDVTFGRPAAATPSLDLGTICLLSPGGTVRAVRNVARSAHDACIVEAG